jgi:hypothetical protein
VLGTAVVGLSLVVFVLWLLNLPPGASPTVAAFTERWTHDDVDGLAELFADGRGATALRKALERRGWQRLPALGEPQVTERAGLAEANVPCDGETMVVRFRRDGDRWRVTSIDLPELVLPEIEPALASFRSGWRAAGTDGLVALFRPESRERVGGSLVRLLEKRAWHERRPELGAVDVGRVDQPRVVVRYTIGFDELTLAFEYYHPSWWLSGVQLPRD